MLRGEREDVSGHQLAHLIEDGWEVLVLGSDLLLLGRHVKGAILEDVVEHLRLIHRLALAVQNGEHLQSMGTDLVSIMALL